jgi:DNA polymerase III gamma/tau subunit
MNDRPDPYAFWRARMAGQNTDAFAAVAHAGFYRTSRGEPVAVWEHEGALVAQVGSRRPVAADAEFCERTFANACQYPVTHEQYTAAMAGAPWPDMDPTVHEQIKAPRQNEPVDEAEMLRDQIDSAKSGAEAYAKVADDETAAKAQSLRARLNELAREADKKREALKKPHLEAGKAIDATWQPLVKDAKGAADGIGKALSAWETEKARRAEAERRRVEEERRKAEEARRLAEEEAAKAGSPPPAPPPAPVVEAPPEPVQTQVRGGYGRAASIREVKVATVVDQDKAYLAMRTHPELVDLIAKLAQRAVNAGHDIAGVEVTVEKKVV